MPWPRSGRPSAPELAERIDRFCRERGVAAASIDGPQGWRDPAEPPGWGRAAERAVRAPGKMGPPGSCVPRTYLAWVTMSVDLFAELASRPGVRLVDEPEAKLEPPVEGYHLLESFPTSTWRTAGLTPLPGKARAARIEPYATELRRAFSLPPFGGQIGHDELQAVVAALPAAALLGGPARAVPRGRPSRRVETHRVEGLIWDAAPAERVEALAPEAPLLVIVTGPAASGKTTLARSIAHELRLPLLAKDDVKEALFDTLGTGDRDWSRRLGGASFELLYLLAERLLGAGRPVIMEGNFDVGRAETGFATLRASAPFRPFQIVCGAPSDVLLARCKERAGSGDRHPGHLDELVKAELETGLHAERWGPLDLDGEVVELDTSKEVDLTGLLGRLRSALGSASG